MLKPTLVAMTLMGCDCDARLCVPLDHGQARFATMEECEAAVVPAIRRGSESHPLIRAQCALLATEEAETMLAAAPQAQKEASGTSWSTRSAIDGGATLVGEAGLHVVHRVGGGFMAVRGGLARAIDGASGAASWVATLVSPR